MTSASRTIKDPTQTLRPSFGTERVLIKNITQMLNERGPSNEQVWGMASDDRIRLVGTWVVEDIGNGTQVRTSTIGDIIEITFVGTGLNYVLQADNTARTMSVSVDGGAYGANFYNSTYDDSQPGRSAATYNIINIASGLSFGIHTAKVRLDSGANARVYGFEVLNANSTTNIAIPKGEIISGGRKDLIPAATSTGYNSGFDGSPTLNGRGGRVSLYVKNGVLGKAITQTNASALYMSSADHTNESVLRRMNWREFGAGRADDFSTVSTTPVNRWFTLNDNCTTLVGQTIVANFSAFDALNLTNTIGTSFALLTFVGTGLDLVMMGSAAGAWNNCSVFIDNVSQGTITGSGTNAQVIKIASGLPFGAHTVRIQASVAASVNLGLTDFIIYGPKEPSIPAGATKFGEYYLNASYVANTTAGILTIGQGTIRHHASREFNYRGNTWGVNVSQINFIGGVEFGTNTNGDSISYTFWGTGFDFRGQTSTAGMATLNVTLNGTALTTANFATAVANSYGGYSFSLATGVLDSNNSSTVASGWNVSGLPLALYTLTITSTSAGSPGFQCDAIDVITPLYAPSFQNGSLSVAKSLTFGSRDEQADTNLTRVKAWVYFNQITGQILSSYNIAGVVSTATGKGRIYFQKPFKNDKYIAVSGVLKNNTTDDANSTLTFGEAGNTGIKAPGNIKYTTSQTSTTTLVDTVFYAVFYGEQEDVE